MAAPTQSSPLANPARSQAGSSSGNVDARLNRLDAEIQRGFDRFGKSEIFFGVSIKPRKFDFDLVHQSAEAETTPAPVHSKDVSDVDPTFGWAGID